MSIGDFHASCRRLLGQDDTELKSYITYTRSLKSLADFGSRTVIAVGLRGVGKSSAYRYLTEFDSAPDVVVAVNPETYALQLLNKDLNFVACRKQFQHDLVTEALEAFVKKDAPG